MKIPPFSIQSIKNQMKHKKENKEKKSHEEKEKTNTYIQNTTF